MRGTELLVLGCAFVLAACSNTTSVDEWRQVSPSKAGQFEQAKAICEGRASETQVSAGRYWIAGAAASDKVFRACMAEYGFVRDN